MCGCRRRTNGSPHRQRQAETGSRIPSRRARSLVASLAFIALGLLGSLLAGAVAATPDCASGPTTSADGATLYGTSCGDAIVVTSPDVRVVIGGGGDDVIYANSGVELVDGGGGDDVIKGELPHGVDVIASANGRYRGGRRKPFTATVSDVVNCSAGVTCRGGLGNQDMLGSTGNDLIFGERGNDKLYGNDGNDKLYGGIGDDEAYGQSNDDVVSGGLGGDTVDGNNGSDVVRGDMTIDSIKDTGGGGTDTVSFATAVTPGFGGDPSIDGTSLSTKAPSFPPYSNGDGTYGERGVYVDLRTTSTQADNGGARYGGGNDTANFSPGGFENVVGSPFSDVLIGNGSDNRIDGGGGADLILGKAGADNLFGGQDGDYLEGGTETDIFHGQWGTNYCVSETGETNLNDCNGAVPDVAPRVSNVISVGIMAASAPSYVNARDFYMTGRTGITGSDTVTVTYSAGARTVSFSATSGTFDQSGNDYPSADCPTFTATFVTCNVGASPAFLGAIVVAGMNGADTLTLSGFDQTATPMILGGEGADPGLNGTAGTEDIVVDGPGTYNDTLTALSRDDALLNNEGTDSLQGGNGNDLLLSNVLCGGDTLQGAAAGAGDGSDKNNASWFQVSGSGVLANLSPATGNPRAGNAAGPSCTFGSTDNLFNIDDLEGTDLGDTLVGDANVNFLLGHKGADVLKALAEHDTIDAKDGVSDTTVDCGQGSNDTALVDGSDPRTSCENIG